jgi:hypothetical protein
VNGGHECVLAVAHSSAESPPLPDPLPPGFDFNPPAHDEIAQRNLSVLETGMFGLPLPITISAPFRTDKEVDVAVNLGGELDGRLLAQIGLQDFTLATGEAVEVGLSREPHYRPRDGDHRARELKVKVQRGTSSGVYLSIHQKNLHEQHYQPIRVVELSNGKVIGGITYVAVHRKGD